MSRCKRLKKEKHAIGLWHSHQHNAFSHTKKSRPLQISKLYKIATDNIFHGKLSSLFLPYSACLGLWIANTHSAYNVFS